MSSSGGLQWGLYTPLGSAEAVPPPDLQRGGGSSGSTAAAAGAAVTTAEGGGDVADGGADSLVAAVGAGLVSGALASWFVAPVDQLSARVRRGCHRRRPRRLRDVATQGAPAVGAVVRRDAEDPRRGGYGVFRGTTMTGCRAMTPSSASRPATTRRNAPPSRPGLREGLLTHALGSLSAGVGASVASAPFDLIKSRLMVAPDRYPGGTLDCLRQTLRAEGVRGLFVGTGAASARLAPATLLYMPLMEQMRYLAGVDYFGVV